MGLCVVTEQTDEKIVLKPGYEQRIAIALALLCAVGIAAGSVFWMSSPVMLVCSCTAVCAFVLVAYLVYNRQRIVEVNLRDENFYVLGKQKSDVYAIAFSDVAALRISGGVVIEKRSAHDHDGLSRPTKKGTPKYQLDIVRHDSGFETLERSASKKDVLSLAIMLSEATGLRLEDDLGEGVAREAQKVFSTEPKPFPDTPPPASVIRILHNRRASSCTWSLSPGVFSMTLMGLVGVGLLLLGMMGVSETLQDDGNIWVGTVTAIIAGFFAYQISWRFLRGVLCNGYAYLNYDGLHVGWFCMDTEREHLIVPLEEIVSFRVVAPRFGSSRLEVLTVSGKRHVILSIAAGLTPITLGDLHWLQKRLSSVYESGRFA